MDSTTEALTPKFTSFGFALAVVAGAIAAAASGFLYHLIANKAGVDYIIVLAAILGAIVGFVVGHAARIGGLRASLVVFAVAFVFGVAGYAARYYFEFNDQVETAVQQFAADANANAIPIDTLRTMLLEELARQYPPGGVLGYLQTVLEGGISIGSRGSSADSGTLFQGTLAWLLLAVEALAAGGVAAYTARGIVARTARASAAIPPMASND